MKRFLNKLALLFRRDQFRNELDEEMAFHRVQVEQELVDGGMPREMARTAAMRQFGNATRLNEQSREVVGFRIESVIQDLRFALRQLRRSPGFALTATAILALGMGVSVAIFSFVDAALLEPLPYASPDRLLSVDESSALFLRSNLSRADYEDWKRENHSFSSLDAYTGTGYLLNTSSGTVPVPAARVSDGFFSTLGIKMMLGRGFLPGEDMPGKPKIAILTYGTWLRRYGGRSDIIGRAVDLSGADYTIVGVLPRTFEFAPRRDSEFWVPLLDKSGCEQRRSCHNLYGVGRLRDGITVDAARAEMKAIAAQLAKQYPGSNQGQSASVIPLAEIIVGPVRPVLLTLLAGAGLLLLIACVNVSSLLLVRSESRRREIAVRGALGATPARLARQFVTEGLLLTAAGCAGGMFTGVWLMKLLSRLIPQNMLVHLPFLGDVSMNAHVIAFAASIALLAALLLAATPVLRLSFQDIRDGLTEGERGAAGRLWKRLGANLVVVELAVAVVLLAGAGLLGKSFYRLLHVDNGFDTTHLATVQVMAPESTYTKDAQKIALYREIERRLGALPGVESVGITSDLPVQCNCDTDWIRIAGKPFHGEHNEVNEREVSPAYFATLKARLIGGRVFTAADDVNHPRVTVINEALAKKYFPGEDPIGKMIGEGDLAPNSMRQVIGVIANVREGAADDNVWPAEYFSIYHETDRFFSVAVRTTQDEKAMLPSIVSALHQIDPNMGVFAEKTMTQQIESSETSLLHQFATWLVAGFAVMALVLGVVGLYGVIAYSVSRRTREIGVRMALGAQRGTVYAMVMRQAGRLTGVGLAIGLVCAIGASLLMRKLLFGVQAWDLPTLLSVAFVLGCASMAASFLPARRAASVNPTDALRAE
ncbi:MAG TPA: ABC transporter permease [Terracidiphilus sp.]|nr:ABC transporter permease [Terracidiphilus sp.]